ncbi:MAG: DUF3866 family protein [Moorellales bacterium]
MLSSRVGTIIEVREKRPGCSELTVEIEGERSLAVNYEPLTGPATVGDRVLLNVTAVQLGLGTGGYHFVMANLSRQTTVADGPGHIIKLRYTPLQFKVLAIEEENSPYRPALEACDSLEGMPVIAAPLHSLLAPAVGGVKLANPGLKVAYVMTEGGALPLAFSRLVRQLREKGLLVATVTVGQAFGGDLEAVNLYSGLLAVRAVVKADVAVVAMGPGHVGTNSRWGFSGLEQGQTINAVWALGGKAVVVPRLSVADPRARHRGLSHHTVTVLGRVALAPAVIALPELSSELRQRVYQQIREAGLQERHLLAEIDGRPALDLLEGEGIQMESMGRGREQDEVFFAAGGAAGILAARLAAGQFSGSSL